MIVHIGKIIKEAIKQKQMDVTEFAEKINYTRGNVYKIFNKQGIDTVLLAKISKVLGENLFFKFISNEEIAAYRNTKLKEAELMAALKELKSTMIYSDDKKDLAKKAKSKDTSLKSKRKS